MSLIVTIVGRPNVGKSALFNRIVGQQKALVHDQPGVTRDRIYGHARFYVPQTDSWCDMNVVDTGGLEFSDKETLSDYIAKQMKVALAETDAIIAVFDGRSDLLPADEEMVKLLRKSGKKIYYCVNKIDVHQHEEFVYPFYKLGIEELHPISALHNHGVDDLLETIGADHPQAPHDEVEQIPSVKVAIIGRPNVGKSSVLNAILGSERAIVSDEPGTTRDPVDTLVSIKNHDYLLIDTAGIRRKLSGGPTLEYLTVIKSLRAISRCDVALLVTDATECMTHQDVKLANQVFQQRRALVCLINKIDLEHEPLPDAFRSFQNVPILQIAAKHRRNVDKIIPAVNMVMRSFTKKLSTAQLNEMIQDLMRTGPTPTHKGKPFKIRYGVQIKQGPPTFKLFCNDVKRLHDNYRKYLENAFLERLKLSGAKPNLIFCDDRDS